MATSNTYKWHYHSAKKNETAAAICAALGDYSDIPTARRTTEEI